MSDSPHSFVVGFTRALERRAKERTKQQTKQQVQTVQKVTADVVTSDAIITKTTIKATNNITNTNNPDALNVVEEQYRTSLITNMIQLIHSKRKPA